MDIFKIKLADLNIDWLKAHNQRLYYFGLGFIQLKVSDKHRFHFYSPELPTLTEDIHNHRYMFFSKVLKGSITHRFWQPIVGDSHTIVPESCNPDTKAEAESKPCSVVPLSTETYKVGQICPVAPHQFHQVSATDCITLLERSIYVTNHARVIYPNGAGKVCPFSLKYTDEELWNIIGRML